MNSIYLWNEMEKWIEWMASLVGGFADGLHLLSFIVGYGLRPSNAQPFHSNTLCFHFSLLVCFHSIAPAKTGSPTLFVLFYWRSKVKEGNCCVGHPAGITAAGPSGARSEANQFPSTILQIVFANWKLNFSLKDSRNSKQFMNCFVGGGLKRIL